MGTFLKVVGVVFLCLGIVAIIFSLIGMSTQKSSSYSLPKLRKPETLNPCF